MTEALRPVLVRIELFGHTLPNRLAVAPMSRVSATDEGLATDAMREYYARFARGGFAIIITEGTYTDVEASQGCERQPGVANERQAASWTPIATAITAAGGMIRTSQTRSLTSATPTSFRSVARHSRRRTGPFGLPTESRSFRFLAG